MRELFTQCSHLALKLNPPAAPAYPKHHTITPRYRSPNHNYKNFSSISLPFPPGSHFFSAFPYTYAPVKDEPYFSSAHFPAPARRPLILPRQIQNFSLRRAPRPRAKFIHPSRADFLQAYFYPKPHRKKHIRKKFIQTAIPYQSMVQPGHLDVAMN